MNQPRTIEEASRDVVRQVFTRQRDLFESGVTLPRAFRDEQLRAFGWARVIFEPGLVVAATHRIEVGTGFGMGFSFPIRRNEDLTGDRINLIWTPSLDARYKIRRWASLMLQFRPIFGERAFTTTQSSDSTEPTVDTQQAKARSLLVLFGTAFSF